MNQEEGKVKIAIELTPEQREGYPVNSESMWFLPEGKNYRLINIPFFVDGISMEDLVKIEERENGYYKIAEIIKESQNSTLWVVLKNPEVGKGLLVDVHKLGCGYEGGVFPGYYTINVPANVNIESVYSILDKAEEEEILVVDYPCIRQ